MVSLIVTYPTTGDEAFDAAYYMASHMPLVERSFGPHGMTGFRVMLADETNAAYAAITTLDFVDESAMIAAMTAPRPRRCLPTSPTSRRSLRSGCAHATAYRLVAVATSG